MRSRKKFSPKSLKNQGPSLRRILKWRRGKATDSRVPPGVPAPSKDGHWVWGLVMVTATTTPFLSLQLVFPAVDLGYCVGLFWFCPWIVRLFETWGPCLLTSHTEQVKPDDDLLWGSKGASVQQALDSSTSSHAPVTGWESAADLPPAPPPTQAPPLAPDPRPQRMRRRLQSVTLPVSPPTPDLCSGTASDLINLMQLVRGSRGREP